MAVAALSEYPDKNNGSTSLTDTAIIRNACIIV